MSAVCPSPFPLGLVLLVQYELVLSLLSPAVNARAATIAPVAPVFHFACIATVVAFQLMKAHMEIQDWIECGPQSLLHPRFLITHHSLRLASWRASSNCCSSNFDPTRAWPTSSQFQIKCVCCACGDCLLVVCLLVFSVACAGGVRVHARPLPLPLSHGHGRLPVPAAPAPLV